MTNDRMERQERSVEPEHSAAPKDTETHHSQQAISQVYRQDRELFHRAGTLSDIKPCVCILKEFHLKCLCLCEGQLCLVSWI